MTVGPDTETNAGEESAAAGLCTLAELPGRVAELLAGNYEGQSSGRVGELPTERSIRWYTTTGLVDRPVTTRNRVALYGPRHVLQLAAIKKLQSEGRSLAEIQRRLLGAADRQLSDLVGAPGPVGIRAGAPEASLPAEFWKRGASWQREAQPAAALRSPAPDGAAGSRDPGEENGDGGTSHAQAAAVVPAVSLGDSVTLVLAGASRTPSAADTAAIAAAAAPLLDLLARLGLTTDPPSPRV